MAVFFFLNSKYGAREPASSDGAGSHRKTALHWLAHLRGANAGRRRISCGRQCSCEAAVVGGDCHLGSSPPAEVWFTGGNHSSDGASPHRKTAMRRLAQLRRANAGRRRISCGRLYSCEAAVVGGDHHLGIFSSNGSMVHRRKSQLRWSEPSSEDSLALANSTPMRECWPEEDAWRVAVLLRSGGGRR